MSEVKVNIESAEDAFDKFCFEMDIENDLSTMNDDEEAIFTKSKRLIIRQIVAGNLTFNDDGEAVFTPCRPKSKYKEPLTFHERTGAHVRAGDGKRENDHVARMHSVLGAICHVPPKVFSGMAGVDLKTCEALFLLLMV